MFHLVHYFLLTFIKVPAVISFQKMWLTEHVGWKWAHTFVTLCMKAQENSHFSVTEEGAQKLFKFV